jgi:hypothetical protein
MMTPTATDCGISRDPFSACRAGLYGISGLYGAVADGDKHSGHITLPGGKKAGIMEFLPIR